MGEAASGATERTPAQARSYYRHGIQRLPRMFEQLEIPVIAAVNGPATVHAELALLCDIVLAADHTVFQDAPHYPSGLVPGDGVHVIWPMLLGPNRGRYFLLTGQRIDAAQALDLGVVSEVLAPEALLPRAHALAAKLARQPTTTLRYTRDAVVQPIRRALLDNLAYGLALEGLGAHASWPAGE